MKNLTLRNFIRESIAQERSHDQLLSTLIVLSEDVSQPSGDICKKELSPEEMLLIVCLAIVAAAAVVGLAVLLIELAPAVIAGIDAAVLMLEPAIAAVGGRAAIMRVAGLLIRVEIYNSAAQAAITKLVAINNAPISEDEKAQKTWAAYGELALNVLIIVMLERFSPTFKMTRDAKPIIAQTEEIVTSTVRRVPEFSKAEMLKWAAKDAAVTYSVYELNENKDNVMESIKRYMVSLGYGDKVLRDLERLESEPIRTSEEAIEADRKEREAILRMLLEAQSAGDTSDSPLVLSGESSEAVTEQGLVCAVKGLIRGSYHAKNRQIEKPADSSNKNTEKSNPPSQPRPSEKESPKEDSADDLEIIPSGTPDHLHPDYDHWDEKPDGELTLHATIRLNNQGNNLDEKHDQLREMISHMISSPRMLVRHTR